MLVLELALFSLVDGGLFGIGPLLGQFSGFTLVFGGKIFSGIELQVDLSRGLGGWKGRVGLFLLLLGIGGGTVGLFPRDVLLGKLW